MFKSPEPIEGDPSISNKTIIKKWRDGKPWENFVPFPMWLDEFCLHELSGYISKFAFVGKILLFSQTYFLKNYMFWHSQDYLGATNHTISNMMTS